MAEVLLLGDGRARFLQGHFENFDMPVSVKSRSHDCITDLYDRLLKHMTPSVKFIVLAVGTNDTLDYKEDWACGSLTKMNVDATVTGWAVRDM